VRLSTIHRRPSVTTTVTATVTTVTTAKGPRVSHLWLGAHQEWFTALFDPDGTARQVACWRARVSHPPQADGR